MVYSNGKTPIRCIMKNSTCYKNTINFTPQGVLWHSTGANNPKISRYVQPHETDSNYNEMISLLGKNKYGNDWNHVEIKVGVNAWIGKLADGTVTSVQTMEWNQRPWGCGSGKNGSCNDTHLQFEICEADLSDKAYFNQVYKEACELTAYLCKLYNLNPHGTIIKNGIKVPVILCHADSHQLGMGSNHGDVLHWFKKHGKTMADVRNDVSKLLNAMPSTPSQSTQETKPVISGLFKVGDEVKLVTGAKYASGQPIPSWLFDKTLYVRELRGSNAVISTLKTGAITGVVALNHLIKIKKAITIENASSYDKSISGTYKTTARVNIRAGAGTNKPILATIPKNSKVTCYGYYTVAKTFKWYYVIYKNNQGVEYAGFISSRYLKK